MFGFYLSKLRLAGLGHVALMLLVTTSFNNLVAGAVTALPQRESELDRAPESTTDGMLSGLRYRNHSKLTLS
jgi:hypothetical protein